MTNLTDEMIAAVEAKAVAFHADPKKSRDAGYQPIQDWQRSREIGGQSERIPMRTEYGAWLFGVAQKDLPSRSWRFQSFVGDGPGSAIIIPL